VIDYSAVRALAFDLDGTLIDTLPDLAAAGNRMLAALDREPAVEEQVRQYIGDGIAVFTRRLLAGDHQGDIDASLAEAGLTLFKRLYAEELTVRSRPYPGVPQALRALAARYSLACVTNKALAYTEPLLTALGMRSDFKLVIGGDSLPRKKPDALPLLHTAASLGVRHEQLLMVGDSANDCACARAAGCPVVCVPYGYHGSGGAADLDCDAIVADLTILANTLLLS